MCKSVPYFWEEMYKRWLLHEDYVRLLRRVVATAGGAEAESAQFAAIHVHDPTRAALQSRVCAQKRTRLAEQMRGRHRKLVQKSLDGVA